MSFRSVFNWIGVGLIGAGFAVSLGRVVLHTARAVDPEQVTVRFSHWQVEAGMREAFDAVAAEYMALNPKVRVEQLPCPGDVYSTFVRTRLIGGDPPELMEQGRGLAPEQLVRHFRPLSPWLEEPNPYNVGTPLEGVPWRQTFLGGLSQAPGLDTLFDYYAVPASEVASRMYYNIDMYRQIMGDAPLPANYRQFIAFCEQAEAWARRTGRNVSPVAGSSGTANVLLLPLFRSQTQRLAQQADALHTLRTPDNVLLSPAVTLDHPAIASGLKIMREVGRYMPPNFLQYDRDDAIFAFSQGRAVCLAAGSWDYVGIRNQSKFTIELTHLPLPTPEHPEYGRFTLGPVSELGQVGSVNLFLAQDGAHPEQAVDFLRYLTSVPGQRTFVRISTWLPAVRHVEPHPESAAFAPIEAGYSEGFVLSKFRWASGEVFRVFLNSARDMLRSDGSVEQFLRDFAPEFPEALINDTELELKRAFEYRQRQESVLAGYDALVRREAPEARPRRSALLQIQNEEEAAALWKRLRLAQIKADMEGR